MRFLLFVFVFLFFSFSSNFLVSARNQLSGNTNSNSNILVRQPKVAFTGPGTPVYSFDENSLRLEYPERGPPGTFGCRPGQPARCDYVGKAEEFHLSQSGGGLCCRVELKPKWKLIDPEVTDKFQMTPEYPISPPRAYLKCRYWNPQYTCSPLESWVTSETTGVYCCVPNKNKAFWDDKNPTPADRRPAGFPLAAPRGYLGCRASETNQPRCPSGSDTKLSPDGLWFCCVGSAPQFSAELDNAGEYFENARGSRWSAQQQPTVKVTVNVEI